MLGFPAKVDDFLDFVQDGSWSPLDIAKTMKEDVQTFSTIGNFALKTSLFSTMFEPPVARVGPRRSVCMACIRPCQRPSARVGLGRPVSA